MSTNRILVVEDEVKLLDFLSQHLRDEGFAVFTSTSISDLNTVLSIPNRRFDLIVLDRLLHGDDSAVEIPKIKKSCDCKVLVLSAINTPSEKAAVLNLGADDYLAKPFSNEELVARIRALLRRDPVDLKLGNVSLNPIDRTVTIGDSTVVLTNREFVLLRTLLQFPRKIFNKAFLYEQVWDMSPEVDSNVVEMTVSRLRRRFEEAKASISIRNARNVGYWVEE